MGLKDLTNIQIQIDKYKLINELLDDNKIN